MFSNKGFCVCVLIIMTTEVVYFPLRDVKTFKREQELKKTLDLLTKQEGFERAYWSWQGDDLNMFWVLVDWTSIEAHRNFQGKDYYRQFVDDLDRVANISRIVAFHTHLSPYPAMKILSDRSSPMTEICMIHFPADYSSSDQKVFEHKVLQFAAILEEKVPTSTGLAGGWAAEKGTVSTSSGSEDSTVFFACVGWQSFEAHSNFQRSDLFQDSKHLFVEAKDVKHSRVVHINGRQVDKNSHF